MAKLLTSNKVLSVLLLLHASNSDGSLFQDGPSTTTAHANKLSVESFLRSHDKLPGTCANLQVSSQIQGEETESSQNDSEQTALDKQESPSSVQHLSSSLLSLDKDLSQLIQESQQLMHQELHKNTGRGSAVVSTRGQGRQYKEIKALQMRAANDAESLEKALKSIDETKNDEKDAQEEEEKGQNEEKGEQKAVPVKEQIKEDAKPDQNNQQNLQLKLSDNIRSSFFGWQNNIQLKLRNTFKNLNDMLGVVGPSGEQQRPPANPMQLQLQSSGTNQTAEQMQKREMERTQLMIALYLGVGITIFLIVIGVVVECLRKRYYEEQDESVTSLDSNDDIQQANIKDQSRQRGQKQSDKSQRNRSGGAGQGADPFDKREWPSRSGGGGNGSRNIREEGGARDMAEQNEDDADFQDGKKGRDCCPCYDSLARSTATCCTFCLGGEDNDLEELEYQAHKRQRERKTRAGTGDDSGALFDFDYFGDRGTTNHRQERQYRAQQVQPQRAQGTIQPRLHDKQDFFIVQEQSRDEIDISLSYDKVRRITQRQKAGPNKQRDKSGPHVRKPKSIMKQGSETSEYSHMSPYSMTKYKHNMKKPSYLLQKQPQSQIRDRSESERLDVSKQSNSSYMQSAQYQGFTTSPFVNYSDNEDAYKSQKSLNIRKINQPEFQGDKSSSQRDQKEGGSLSATSTFNQPSELTEARTDSVTLKSNNMNITFQDLIK